MNQDEMKYLLDRLSEEHRQLQTKMYEFKNEMMNKLNSIETRQEKTRDKVCDYLARNEVRTEAILSVLSRHNDVSQVTDLEGKCLTLLHEKVDLMLQNNQLEKDIEQLKEKLRDAGMSKPRQSDQPTEDDSSEERGLPYSP